MAPGMLRPIREADNAAVASIIRGVLTSLGCTGLGIAIHDPEVDYMYETYQQPRSDFFVVEHEGRVVGCGGVAPLKGGDAGTCELQKLYILEEYRGLGYGRQLVEIALEAGRKHGFARCYIETLPPMVKAAAMYERAGFIRIDRPMGNTGHFACDRWYIREL